ncbi:MAG: T9SS type A sorting domain-containing protein [Calditrichaeota bacterium]|nr:T9SS type A sorting domain-containing protein [Calditrichota bacterium]
MTRFALVLLVFAVIHTSLAAPSTKPMRNVKPIDGREQPVFQHIPDPSTYGPHRGTLDDLVGTSYVAGTTYYDYQHNGTSGKMIGVDELGFVHVTWTNGLDPQSNTRGVYYNVWDPSTETFTIFNGQVDVSSRAGYTCGAMLPGGFFFPAFHQELVTNGTAHTAVGIDLFARAGAYTTFEPSYLHEGGQELEIIWPKVAISPSGIVHVVSTENPASGVAGDPQRIYYSRGVPVYQDAAGIEIVWDDVANGEEFWEVDSVMVISPDIACSRHGDRVVMAWSKSRDDLTDNPTQYNNDIVYMVSDDGGDTWGPEVNITNFLYPDTACASGDSLACDRDTFRVYTDLSLLLDESDNIHIAFTTTHYYALEGTISRYSSQIWHWGSDQGYVSPIFAVTAEYGDTNWADDLGDWQYVLQRPNLSIDPTTNDLYCCFVLASDSNWSNLGIPMQDVWVSKSWNNGVAWTQAVNVTNTNTGQDVPPGQSAHERDATLSETVTYDNGVGYLHMSYIFDLDAGGAVGANPIGSPTLNPVHYQRIAINDIPNMPLWPNNWPVLHVDSTDMPPLITSAVDDRVDLPTKFTLYQNYPNPFNPNTTIQFDLAQSGPVSLKVFNLLGEEVATLLSSEPLSAGVQYVNFDAAGLASGVYLYQLETQGLTQTRKMVLLK